MDNRKPLDQQSHWNTLYTHLPGREHNAGSPSAFAQAFGAWLGVPPQDGRLLELGCGAGEDSYYFDNLGMQPVGLDFSRRALVKAQQTIDGRVWLVQQHLAQGLPFVDGAFSAAFAHLSLHYFDDEVSHFLFGEIHRVLRLKGVFALRVKSVESELFGRGVKIGLDCYQYRGHMRRFFRPEFLDDLIRQRPWHKVTGWKEAQAPGYLTAVLQKVE